MTDANDYDRYASARQKELRNGQKLPHRFVEKPAMKALLPNLQDMQVLMLGCGSGEESLMLEDFGASKMIGIDLSAESVRLANETYPSHTFEVGDMHKLRFEDNSFDFIYSSLTIHYSSRPLHVYGEIFRTLKPGGQLLFSVGHPMRWASERLDIDGQPTKLMGYTEGDVEPRLYGNYSDFRQYQETFKSGEILEFWIGPPSMHFALMREAGFDVTDFVETKAIKDCKEVDLNYYKRFSKFPQFTIFSAKKADL